MRNFPALYYVILYIPYPVNKERKKRACKRDGVLDGYIVIMIRDITRCTWHLPYTYYFIQLPSLTSWICKNFKDPSTFCTWKFQETKVMICRKKVLLFLIGTTIRNRLVTEWRISDVALINSSKKENSHKRKLLPIA